MWRPGEAGLCPYDFISFLKEIIIAELLASFLSQL